MKSSQITLIVIGFILLALMATNPSIEDHRQAVTAKMKEKMTESSNSESKNEWQKAGEAIGMAIGGGIVEKSVSRDNYLLFSLTKFSFPIDERGKNFSHIGLGICGKVWMIWYDNFQNEREQRQINKRIEREFDSLNNDLHSGHFSWMNPDPIGDDIDGFCDSIKLLEYGFNKGHVYGNYGTELIKETPKEKIEVIVKNSKNTNALNSINIILNESRKTVTNFYVNHGFSLLKSESNFDLLSNPKKTYKLKIKEIPENRSNETKVETIISFI